MNDEIMALAASKQFEDLSGEEQCFVRKTLTESEYRKISQTLGVLPKIDAAVAPSPLLKAALMAQFTRVQPDMQTPHRAWYNYPVAFWQAAAAVMLIIGGVLYFRSPDPNTVIKTETVTQIDTVFVEKVIWKERVVFRERSKRLDSGKKTDEMAVSDTVVVPVINPLENAQPISAQPELLQFFTGERGQ